MKIIFNLFILLFSLSLYANQENCSDIVASCKNSDSNKSNNSHNFEKIFKKYRKISLKEDKPLFLYLYKNNCKYCIEMKKSLISNKITSSILKNKVIFMEINSETIPKDNLFYVPFSPVIYIIPPQKKFNKNDLIILYGKEKINYRIHSFFNF